MMHRDFKSNSNQGNLPWFFFSVPVVAAVTPRTAQGRCSVAVKTPISAKSPVTRELSADTGRLPNQAS